MRDTLKSRWKYGGKSMDNRIGLIIQSILEVADKLLEADKNQVNTGSLMTYAEVLTIIQEQLTDEERKQFKLDFDIDKKYM